MRVGTGDPRGSVSVLKADLYLNQIDHCRYWPVNAPCTCEHFLTQIKSGERCIEDYAFLTSRQIQAFKVVAEAERYLAATPLVTLPQPMEAGLFPINEPGEGDLVIVSGNCSLTFEVLTAVWAQGITPAYFLLVDCLGNTVDMAMVYGDFTPERLCQALEEGGLREKVDHRRLILPGLTSPLVEDFIRATGWEIEVGPICAAELPLFLGDRWMFPDPP